MSLRTITLTDRAPVRIDEAAWPEVASAHAERGTQDNLRLVHTAWPADHGSQPVTLSDEHVDRWNLRVRRHADGRQLVYGTWSPGWDREPGDAVTRAGELLDAGDDVIAAMRRVAASIGASAQMLADAIADLPPEVLV